MTVAVIKLKQDGEETKEIRCKEPPLWRKTSLALVVLLLPAIMYLQYTIGQVINPPQQSHPSSTGANGDESAAA